MKTFTVRYGRDYIELRPITIHEPLLQRVNWLSLAAIVATLLIWGSVVLIAWHEMGH